MWSPQHVERVAQHRNPASSRILQRLADGRWIEIKERPTGDGGVIGLWTDITAQVRSEMRLEDAIQSTGDGFAVWDQAERLVLFNDKYAQLHNYGESTLLGRRGRGQQWVDVPRRFRYRNRYVNLIVRFGEIGGVGKQVQRYLPDLSFVRAQQRQIDQS